MENLKRTPLYERHLSLKAKMVEFGGWEMPIQYSGIIEEHQSVRNHVGIFDVCHMGEVEISGEDSESFVNHLTTNDVKLIDKNQIQYAVMCYENGGVVDDLLVYKREKNEFLLIINASNIDKDLKWMNALKEQSGYSVSITDISDKTGEVALQGPKAEVLLQKFVDINLSSMKFFHFSENIKLFGADCIISRSGYTGEDGFEIYSDKESIVNIWDNLLQYGKGYNLLPCGLGARDTLRFEANLPLYGHEMSEDISPLEAGYGFCVRLDKEDFVGKAALKLQKEKGLERKVVGFEMTEKGIARSGYPVLDLHGNKIGHVTTGYKSPTLDKSIGLAIVANGFSRLNQDIVIQIRNKELKAKVVSRKFLDKNYKN